MKPIINGVVIVEGRSDTQKLKSLFDVETIETGGNQISHRTIELIKRTEQERQIILFFDPDYTGEQIRRKISGILSKPYKQCFIHKSDVVGKKIGIAEAKPDAIIRAFEACYCYQKNQATLSQLEFDQLNLNTKLKRIKLCQKLKISYANQKQLLKRLNMLGLTKEKVQTLINEDI